MEKTYLITINQADLEAIIFSAVNRAITLNKMSDKDLDIKKNVAKKAVTTKPNKANG